MVGLRGARAAKSAQDRPAPTPQVCAACLGLQELAVGLAALGELFVRAAIDQAPAVEHQDRVGAPDRGEAVRDEEDRGVRERRAQAPPRTDPRCARRGWRCSRRAAGGRAGRPGARAMAIRCFCPPLTSVPRRPSRCRGPSGMRSRSASHLRDRRGSARIHASSPSRPNATFSRDRLREERRLLRHVADAPAQGRGQSHSARRPTVHRTACPARREEAREHAEQRGLAAADRTDDGDALAAPHGERRRRRAPAAARRGSGSRRRRAPSDSMAPGSAPSAVRCTTTGVRSTSRSRSIDTNACRPSRRGSAGPSSDGAACRGRGRGPSASRASESSVEHLQAADAEHDHLPDARRRCGPSRGRARRSLASFSWMPMRSLEDRRPAAAPGPRSALNALTMRMPLRAPTRSGCSSSRPPPAAARTWSRARGAPGRRRRA